MAFAACSVRKIVPSGAPSRGHTVRAADLRKQLFGLKPGLYGWLSAYLSLRRQLPSPTLSFGLRMPTPPTRLGRVLARRLFSGTRGTLRQSAPTTVENL